MAGIALGTAGFIVIQTMGHSVEKKMGEHLELLGEATVLKAYWQNDDNYHPGQFTMQDVVRLKRIPHMMAVAPVVSLPQIDAAFRTNQWCPGLFGVDNEYWMTQSPTVLRGRLLGPSDVVARKNVCVLGHDVVKYLFEKSNPVGERITAGNLSFKVIGMLGGIQHTDIRRSIFIPITTAQNLFQGLYRIHNIFLRADDWNHVKYVKDRAMRVLTDDHKGYESGIKIQFFPDRLQRVKSTVYLVKLFVYAALGVTIILGGLGITSVMLAAVQDRTREIGLRKALGAGEGIILLQFLIEAVFISLLSGSAGVAAGFSLVQLLKGVLGVEVSSAMITVSILGGLAFTFLLGVISGIYPSIRASRLDSVTAMRFE
jgi:putative ABC transport system permease protein